MERSSAAERKRPLIRSLDYLCVRRFRLRRLLAFLWSHSYNGAFESLSKETRVLFRVEHLQHLVRLGLWSDAMGYVFRFVPAFDLPVGGQFLVTFINFLWEIAAYDPTDPSTFPEYDPTVAKEASVPEESNSLRSSALGSINWPLVRFKAAEISGTWLLRFQSLMRCANCRSAPPGQPKCFLSA
nr:unnamed protein product [Digitaria exilis]